MNESTDVRSNEITPATTLITPTPKTDVPPPLVPTIEEVAPPRPADRMISGIDLLDYGAGGLLPHKMYLVRGGSGVGKTLLGLQYLTRGLELHEPGVLITDQKPQSVIAQAHSIGFAIDESVRRGQLAILNPSGRYFDLYNRQHGLEANLFLAPGEGDRLEPEGKEAGANGREATVDPLSVIRGSGT